MDGASLSDAAAPVAARPRVGSASHWRPSGPSPSAATSPPAATSPSESASITPTGDEPGWSVPAGASAAVDDEEPLIGVVLGDRYRVDSLIGSGGMGLVYRATHLLIGRTLAIKVLRRRHAEQEGVAQRFAQEAQVASSVKHPNIVDVLDYGRTPQDSPYCVMEFLSGHSLAREISRFGPLDPARAVGIAAAIARGLAAAHRLGIIHRDLKPDNVFLGQSEVPGEGEEVKILDFGIARVSGRKTRLTAAGSVVGTPEYMSPEQARGEELDARSDIYALGVVLFEALTGQVPISGASSVGTLTKQVFELPPRLRDVAPQLSHCGSIETALGRLLAKNRDERPGTALDAAQLLQTAVANDLELSGDPRSQAAVDGLSGPLAQASVHPDAIRRRSTIMIGSGSVAHEQASTGDGPATGSFSARARADASALPQGPSVVVAEGVSAQTRTPDPLSKTPTPQGTPSLGKPPRRGLRRRHLPILLVCIGAAIFAALVTIGFARWFERRAPRTSARQVEDLGGPEYHSPGRSRTRCAQSDGLMDLVIAPVAAPRRSRPDANPRDYTGGSATGQKMR